MLQSDEKNAGFMSPPQGEAIPRVYLDSLIGLVSSGATPDALERSPLRDMPMVIMHCATPESPAARASTLFELIRAACAEHLTKRQAHKIELLLAINGAVGVELADRQRQILAIGLSSATWEDLDHNRSMQLILVGASATDTTSRFV
jgi:hypothetical protein